MQFATRLIPLALLALASTGCTMFRGGKPLVLAASTPCTVLVPAAWKQGVAHAPDPEPAPPAPVANPTTAPDWKLMYEWAFGEQRKWVSFGVAEAQKVEDANGRTRDAIDIVATCEDRDAAAIKKAAK